MLQPPLSTGCGEDRSGHSKPDDLTVAGSDAPLTAAECERGKLEADFQGGPLAGPNVRDGALIAGEYIISSTFLQLRAEPETRQHFGELMQPIMADLMTRDGLLALSFGDSMMEPCSASSPARRTAKR